MNAKRRAPWRRHRGIALILVLWVVVMLSIVAASFSLATRYGTRIAASQVARAQLDAAAEAGIRLGILALLGRQPGGQQPAETGPVTVNYAGYRIDLDVSDANARVDLNHAPPALIKGLFKACINDAGRAEALAEAVLDWRDPDSERRPHGAELPDYRNAGMAYGPRNGPFLSVDELSQVKGMTNAVVQHVRDLVTVDSGLTRINPAYAARSILLAVPGADAKQVDRYLQKRKAGAVEEGDALQLYSGDSRRYVTRAESRVYTITATARAGTGDSERHQATIRLTGNQMHPYVIINWSAGVSINADETGNG